LEQIQVFLLVSIIAILVPHLPGDVSLSVMFAWFLIILGSYGVVKRSTLGRRGIIKGTALYSALLAVFLDLAIEPVAAQVVFYWRWLAQGPFDYHGVPLINLERGLVWRLCCL
jgi:uncharacterized membrane protein